MSFWKSVTDAAFTVYDYATAAWDNANSDPRTAVIKANATAAWDKVNSDPRTAAIKEQAHEYATAAWDKAKSDPHTAACVVGGTVAGVLLAPYVATAGLNAIGFTANGVAGGSPAAGWMSTYGGSIPAGSAYASLQSAGALGTGSALTQSMAFVGGAAGAYMGGAARFFAGCKTKGQDEDEAEGETEGETEGDNISKEEEERESKTRKRKHMMTWKRILGLEAMILYLHSEI
ncbi:hypothetical protein DFQ28_002947 [Apophysomyces sp. BC1034]|nr:hypothetical protein DFQ29_000032 [Apophysomyces sp. BC1021]KAG0183614.1 hypothetical protein DFQ29_000039 [Apophysomyces sp. BC1021]KAG0194872.1 hypothetical protein DFQ28_002947 [Apophysomyces sp. BC1034]